MSASRMGVRRHHCVRFSLKRKFTEGPDKIEMSRLEISRSVIQRTLKFVPSVINCIIALPNGNSWDVSFAHAIALAQFWKEKERLRGNEVMNQFDIEALTDNSVRTVVIKMYNEMVAEQDIQTWLERYCIVKKR